MQTHPAIDGPDPDLEFLQVMLKEYQDYVGSDNEIMRIGTAGYAVRLGRHKVNPNGDWVIYDLDDTLIGYTQAKKVRLDHYRKYLSKHHIDLDEKAANSLISTSDILSRWIEQGRNLYHIDAHVTLLAWATETISTINSSLRSDWAEEFKKRSEQLAKSQPARTPGDLPFYFSDTQLVFDEEVPGAKRIGELYESVFDAMIRPERNEDLLVTIKTLDKETKDETFRLNQGILTYGTPDFQFRKVLELLKDTNETDRELSLSYVLLARVKKGVFLEELLSLDPYTNPNAMHTDLSEDLFNDTPHAILLVDDDPVELESFVSNNGNYGEFRYDLDLMGIRYRHRQYGTKNFDVVATYDEHAGRIGHHTVDNDAPSLHKAVYSLLDTQVTPPQSSPAASENRWQISKAKKTFYDRMTDKAHPISPKHADHRQAEYLAGRRLPHDLPEHD